MMRPWWFGLTLLPLTAALAQNYPNPTFAPAAGGNTARTAASRALDAGFSVLESGAKCDGATDDTAAITAALRSGNQRVTVPAGAICYSAAGIVLPAGVTLAGLSFSPSTPPTGSEILCAAATADCVSIGNANNTTGRLENLIVASNATGTPTGVGVFINEGGNVTLSQVMAYNFAIGYRWYAHGQAGLGGKMREAYSGRISDAHLVVDGWPELRIDNSRFGLNGSADLAGNAYVRITGGDPANPTGTGPNTLFVSNTQFNVGGSGSIAHWLQFINCGGTCLGGASPVNATLFKFAQIEVENVTSDAIFSDATWNSISQLSITESYFNVNNHPFLALNAATSLANVHLTSNDITQISGFTLAPTTQINDVTITGNSFAGPVSLTSPSSSSTLGFVNNAVFGNLTLAGPWASLSVLGGDIRGGALVNTATGNLAISVPYPGAPGNWVTYTPAVTAWLAGAITSYTSTGAYQTINNTTCINDTVSMTNAGTATSFFVGLPNVATRISNFPGTDNSVAFTGQSTAGVAAIFALSATGAALTPTTGHNYVISGCYQNN